MLFLDSKNTFFLIFLFLCFFSCEIAYSQQEKVYNQTKKVQKINSVPVKIDGELLQPNNLKIFDRFAVLTDESNKPPVKVFQILDKDVFNHLHDLGNEGRGPGEYQNPWAIVDGNDNFLFYIYDSGTRRLTPYDHDFELLSDDIIQFRSQGAYTELLNKRNSFFASGVTLECPFEVFDKNGEKTDCVGEHPDLNLSNSTSVNPASVAARWHSYATENVTKDRIALFYRHATKGSLYSLNGTLIETIEDPQSGVPNVEIVEGNVTGGSNDLRAYISVTSDSDYIYALYSGKIFRNASSSLGSYIHKFDWDLKLINVYKIDHSAIHLESVGKNKLYSIKYEPSPEIRFIDLD